MNKGHGPRSRASLVVQNKSLYSHNLLYEKRWGKAGRKKNLVPLDNQDSFPYVKIKYSLNIAFLVLLDHQSEFYLRLFESQCSPAWLCLPQLQARFLFLAPIRIASLILNVNRRDGRDGLSTGPQHRCEQHYWQCSPGFAGHRCLIQQCRGRKIFYWSRRVQGTHPVMEAELCLPPSHTKTWHPACLRGFKKPLRDGEGCGGLTQSWVATTLEAFREDGCGCCIGTFGPGCQRGCVCYCRGVHCLPLLGY